MKWILFLLISVLLASTQRIYNPGVSFMMRNVLIDKIRKIVIPDIMKKFHTIRPADIGHSEFLYELRIYNMRGEIKPLTGDQIQVVTSDQDNSLYVKVTNFEMEFYADAYGRALFICAHGDARIHVKISEFSFKAEPRLKADGDKNKLDYWVDSIKVHLNHGDIHLDHLSLGFLPSWLMTPIGNHIINSCVDAYRQFEGAVDKMIVEILDKNRQDIPDSIDMNPFIKYPLTMSLSFPNVPHLFPDRIEIPFDGTIYLTSEGYHPFQDPALPMPSFNPSNPNNIQLFINQHVVKTTVATARKTGLHYEINSDTLKPFGLVDDVLKVEYLSLIFPRLACHFDSSQTVRIIATIDNSLNTDINFAPDKVHGEFSPNLKFLVGDQHAFTLSLRAIFDATTTFEMRDKQSFAKANLDNVDLADIRFGAGAVEEVDIDTIINLFKPTVIPIVKNVANKILNPGFVIPVFVIFKDMFEVDIDDILMQMKDKYMEASFTLDIHNRKKLIEKLLKYGIL